MSELYWLTISEASERLRKREISSRELTQAHLDRIAAVEPQVQAFVNVTADHALAQADAADKRLAAGEHGVLLGVPVALTLREHSARA